MGSDDGDVVRHPIVELRPLDAIRVAPHVMRCWEGGPDGLQVLAFGVHKDDDFDVFPPTWDE